MNNWKHWTRFLLAFWIYLNEYEYLAFGGFDLVFICTPVVLLSHYCRVSLSLHRIWRERSSLMSSDRKSSPLTARLSRPSARLWPGLLTDRWELPRATVCVCVCVCVRWAYSADNQRQFGCWISGWSVALCSMYNLKYIAIGQTKRVVFICNNLFFSDSVCWIHRQPDQSLAGDHRNPIKMYISKNRMQNMENWIIIKKR